MKYDGMRMILDEVIAYKSRKNSARMILDRDVMRVVLRIGDIILIPRGQS